eukprot:5286429-Prymnesium_polylepis.1
MDAEPTGRRPASAPGLTELFLNPEQAGATSSVLESVASSNSVLVVDAVGTAEECKALASEASSLARQELEARAMLESMDLLDD